MTEPLTPQRSEGETANFKMDPRSPSQNVKRTPMKVVASSFDPRSPSQNVARTPIQISTSRSVSENTALMCEVKQVLNYENEPYQKSPSRDVRERVPLLDKNN